MKFCVFSKDFEMFKKKGHGPTLNRNFHEKDKDIHFPQHMRKKHAQLFKLEVTICNRKMAPTQLKN